MSEDDAEQAGSIRMLTELFLQTGDTSFLADAVENARNALRGSLSRYETTKLRLGTTLRLGYEWLGDVSDLREAISALRAAAETGEAGHRAANLVELCIAQRLLYTATGDSDALDEVITLARRGVDTTPLDRGAGAHLRLELGHALLEAHARTGDMAHLREALAIAQEPAAEHGGRYPEHAARLCFRAQALGAKFRRSGELTALRQAVEFARDAIAASDPPHLHRATYRLTLVELLHVLAERAGDNASAREAVSLGTETLTGFGSDDPKRASSLSALSRALMLLAGLTGDHAMMQDAARCAEESLLATPYEHTRYVERLADFIRALMSMHRDSGRREFLDRAVHATRDAVASTPPDHPDRAVVLSNLCVVWETAVKVGVTGLDLGQAVGFARAALVSTPPDHPDRAGLMVSLADILTLQDEQAGSSASLSPALGAYSAVARMTSVAPTARVIAAQRAASLNLRNGRRHQAMAMVEAAVELVPQTALRDVDRASREHRLRALHGLAATAAAAAIAVGDPARAVELLEQTRGLVLAGTLETRGEITELHSLAPDLVEPFVQLRLAVNNLDHEETEATVSLSDPERGAPRQGLANRRAQLNTEWEQLLARIRRRDGLAHFLQPQPIGELRFQAAEGPVVYITTHGQRGAALIVSDDSEHPVRLLDLPAQTTATAVDEQVSKLREARAAAADGPVRQRKKAQTVILEVLDWTWHSIAEPILRSLGLVAEVSPDLQTWPRIWWCPVGLIGFLPLHAAGCNCQASAGATVMDRVISSYTPTIRALAHLRERGGADQCSTVVVAVPDAPECPPLQAADREVRAVRALVPQATLLPPDGAGTSRDDVIDALTNHHVAHLACHAVADWTDPARNRLILHDHLVNPLRLHDITRLDLRSAQLIYLSACSTMENNPLQVDEATQLTAAFQLAGYRHVIGTLWPITDDAAEEVARAFYQELTRDGTTQPIPDKAPEAIHRAVRQQREQSPMLPTRWAAHCHYGA